MGDKSRNSRRRPKEWSSSPNMWKDPKSVTGGRKDGCPLTVLLLFVLLGDIVGFVYAVVWSVLN